METFGTITTNGIVTIGGTLHGTSNCIDYGQYWYWPWYYPWPQPYSACEPSFCIGRAHVFECDHVTTCKCGKIQRSNPAELEK